MMYITNRNLNTLKRKKYKLFLLMAINIVNLLIRNLVNCHSKWKNKLNSWI